MAAKKKSTSKLLREIAREGKSGNVSFGRRKKVMGKYPVDFVGGELAGSTKKKKR